MNSPRDLVLLIVAGADGTVSGRTTLQKLAYFVGHKTGIEVGHNAHFFGPFSSTVEDGAMLAVIAGELDEDIKRFPDWYGGPDVRQYIYRLTDAGQQRVSELSAADPTLEQTIRTTIALVREHVPDLSQRTLSTAAKIALIVRREGRTQVADIPTLAEKLGWQLEEKDVERTIGLLNDLGMVSTST